jgi:hypothetical protein
LNPTILEELANSLRCPVLHPGNQEEIQMKACGAAQEEEATE